MTTVPLASLSVFPATREQIIESRTRSFASWGRGISLEQYLTRDASLDNHEVSKDNRLVTWVLAPRDAPDSLDFMCSCETFRRDGLVARGAESESGFNPPDEVNCYAIASVFTPADNRGKGYAQHMMKLLHWLIATSSYSTNAFPVEWGAPPQRPSYIADGSFSVLYSDVGDRFYTICGPEPTKDKGWLITRPISTTWDVAKSHKLFPPSNEHGTKTWTWLDEDLVGEIWKADAKLMKQEMSRAPATHLVTFTFLPTKGVAHFQQHRLQHFWQKMNPTPIYWGLCLQTGTSSDASTFATWTLDVRPPEVNTLIMTRLRSRPEYFEDLLFKVVDFAKDHSVDVVEVWNLESNLQDIAKQVGGTTFSREDHLPSFKWYGPEDPKDTLWIYNEKFSWC